MKYKSNKIVTAVLAILLVIVIAGAAALVGVLSNGFKDWTKFQPDEQTDQTDETADNGGAIIGESIGNGIKLMSAKIASEDYAANAVSEDAEMAYTVSVITDPVEVDDTFSWSCTNNTELSLQVSLDTKSCTVTCTGAFDTQAVITVVSELNSDVSATATVDYVKRLESFDFSVSDNVIRFGGEEGAMNTITPIPAFGVGTITPSVEIMRVELSPSTWSPINDRLYFRAEENGDVNYYEYIAYHDDYASVGSSFSLTTPYDLFVYRAELMEHGNVSGIIVPTEENLKTAFNQNWTGAGLEVALGGSINASVTYRCYYSLGSDEVGNEYSFSDTLQKSITLDTSAVIIPANDITFDKPNVVF